MSRLLKLAGECAHTRNIHTATYSADENHLVSEGRLTDIRLLDWYKFTGEKVDCGVLHDLRIVLLIKIPEMIIEDLEVIIETIPREDCLLMMETLKPVIGMAITGGFSAKVRGAAGGVKGCTHLVHLLTTMGPAIMQGFWTYTSGKLPEKTGSLNKKAAESMRRNLKNSCVSWREEGELYQKLSKLMEEKSPGI